MRIAVVTTSYPAYEGDPSGHFVQTEVAELERAGHDVRVLSPDAGGAFGWPGAAARLAESPLRIFEAVLWARRAARRLKAQRAERVIAHWCVPCAFPIAVGALGRGASFELEIVSHGADVRLLARIPGAARTRIVRAVLDRAARWRFVSEELRGTLQAGLPPDLARELVARSEVVPSALDIPDVKDDSNAKRSTIAGRRLYVCAGRLVASKRVDKVIDYVASSSQIGRAERVLVVLGDGPERAHLERLARAWQMDVRFLGKTSRREALGWIGAADELVHASRVEGLSTVIREAERLGVHVTILS